MSIDEFSKSSFCHAGGCVEVAILSSGEVAVRDNKIPDSPVLLYTLDQWRAFIAGVKAGEFDVALAPA